MKKKSASSKGASVELVTIIRREIWRRYSAEENIHTMLSGMPGEESIPALCRREGKAEILYRRGLKTLEKKAKHCPTVGLARQATSLEVGREKTVIISAVTRMRPLMFYTLLKSLEKLHVPPGTELQFCFVENGDSLSIDGRVKEFCQITGFKAVAICEPRLGIPFARNAALNWALDNEADFLAFIDDDEVAKKDWMEKLYAAIEARGLDLVGGPVCPVAPDQNLGNGRLSTIEATVFRGCEVRAHRMARRNSHRSRADTDHQVTIVTNNWLCRLDFLRQNNVKFDEGLGYSGGSDAAFFRAAKKAKARTGWVPDAVVMEEVPVSRLTLGYHFMRGRDQAISSYVIKFSQNQPSRPFVSSLLFVVSKLLLGMARLIAALFDRGRSVVLAMRAFGFAWGRILAVFGYSSSHYKNVHGS